MNAEHDDLIEQAVEKVRQLCRKVQEASVTLEDAWFRNLLIGLLRSALMDYYSVKVGVKKSTYLAAWGCRNLAELRVITLFILASKQNAIDFRNDMIIDVKEFYEAFSKHGQEAHKNLITKLAAAIETVEGPVREGLEKALQQLTAEGPQTQGTDAVATLHKRLMIEAGLPPNATPKRAPNIAKLVQEKESFDPMFKICSKLMHRTAMSIASTTTANSLDGVVPFFKHLGATDLLSIYEAINEHFEKHGVLPPA
jgi:hypothetical protein